MRADGSTNRRQFLITTALVTGMAGFLLVASIGHIVADLQAADQTASGEASLRARILANNAVLNFTDVRKTLGAGAGVDTPERLSAIIAGNALVRSAAIFDAGGGLKIHTDPRSMPVTTIADQAFFPLLRGGAEYGLFVLERTNGRTPIPVAAAGIDAPDGTFAGVAVAELALDDFDALYRNASRGGSVLLLGSSGQVMTGWPPAADGRPWTGRDPAAIPAFASERPTPESGQLIARSTQEAYTAGYRPINLPATILVAVPRPAQGLWTIATQPTVLLAAIAALVAAGLLVVLQRLAARHDAAALALSNSQVVAARQFAELESLYNTAMVGLSFIGKDLRVVRINEHLARINGVPVEQQIGRTLRETLPEVAEVVEPIYRRVMETGQPVMDVEFSVKTPADPDRMRACSCSYHPIRDARGEIIGINAVVQDITDRKNADAALRQSEQRFRIAAECISDLIYEWNIRTGQIHWFGDIDAHLGYAPGEVLRTIAGWKALIHPDDRAATLEAVDRHLKSGGEAVVEYRVRRRDGSELIWSDRGRVVADADGRPLLLIGAVDDITERRRSVATERRLLHAIEHMSEGLALWDADDRLVFCNERYRQLSGAAGPILVPGLTFEELLRSSMAACLIDEAVGREAEWLAERLAKHFHPTGPIEVRREGRWLRIHEHRLPDGGIIVALASIHAQKQQEEQLRQAQKMEAVGHLTGGVAHDFNNLLAVILGNLEMLEERTKPGMVERDMLAAALRASRRGAELTQRLLAFARRQPLSPEITDLRALVNDLVPMLRRTLGETIEIVSLVAPDLGMITADRGQLENVLINLCVNARDAMPGGGRMIIDLRNIVLDERYSERQDEVRPGPYVVIAVSDTGTGMAPEVQRRAFEPFFTTKDVGKGSGLGLSTAYGFVKQSGGHITLYSEPDYGTTVKLYFPRAESEASAVPAAPESGTISHSGTGTILLVEDDADVRALAATLLTSLGYQVLQAANGRAAIDLIARAGPIDLLLTDVILPGGMLGPMLAAEVAKLRPRTRVLFMSGYTEDALIHGGRLDEGVELISKPFRKADLAAKIRQILRGGREP